jgi:hypothetical protein
MGGYDVEIEISVSGYDVKMGGGWWAVSNGGL